MTKMITGMGRRTALLVSAFAAVYILWGSTYLAIRYAIETLPPLLMASTRFLISGAILFAIARFSCDYERPTAKHWRTSFIVGTLLLLGGNGGVVLAEKYVSSSVAALLVASEPFWVVLLSWLWLKNARPNLRMIVGLVVGFIGVALLIGGNFQTVGGGSGTEFLAMLLLIAASISWAVGSIYGLKAPVPKSTVLTAGMQMLAGGAVLGVVGTLRGEAANFDVSQVSAASLYGLAYLIVFGAIIGYTAYSWLLKNAKPEMVATYAYVNPLIAVLLGWFIAGETLTTTMLIGAAIVVGSVALITSREKSDDPNIEEPITLAPPMVFAASQNHECTQAASA
ncbi:MAG: drug/metabolite exporter YedA [Acidobacteria bacterium ACB1]|nr:putative inner membrane transporter YedA [Pyrinomonadaceae bacterium]MCE7961341.1 drug/metabolite exporter YedA [Acidobacteria bacterium ACB1]RIJ91651.1 MAG: drug/metabolite exporter YedA [Acidobacteriota bacterium]